MQDREVHGIKARITTGGLQFIAERAIEQLEKHLLNKTLDDISGSYRKFDYHLTQIRITKFVKPKLSVTIDSDLGARFKSNGGAIKVIAEWAYKWKFLCCLHDRGTVTAWSNNMTLDLSTLVIANSEGKPLLDATSCAAFLPDAFMHCSGSRSRIYNALLEKFKGRILTATERAVCTNFKRVVMVNGNLELSTLDFQTKLKYDLVLDNSLAANPIFTPEYIEFLHKGVFHDDPEAFKETKPYKMNNQAEKMISISICELTLNSAGRAIFAKNIVQYSRTFNHQAILDFFGLSANSEVHLEVAASRPPSFLINENGIKAMISVICKFTSDDPTNGKDNLLTLDFDGESIIQISFFEDRLKFWLSSMRKRVGISYLTNDNFESSILKNLIDEAIESIVPVINEILYEGIRVPTSESVDFTDSEIKLFKNFISISLDLKSTEPEEV